MVDGDKRIALVIGNGAYDDAIPLLNPANDAKAVAAALGALGFELITVGDHTGYNIDLSLISMARALADFSVAAESAKTAIFYFAGHGLEVDGQNYLLPKDARLCHVRRIYFETIKLADVRAAVEHASHLRLILLDACRNDPFRVPMRGLEGRRSVTRGFANIEPSGNTGIVYAAKHGTMAKDGPFGGNSPFASALLKHLPTPDLEIRLLFGRIRDEVWEATDNTQEPHFYNNFGGQERFLVSSSMAQAVKPEAPKSAETPTSCQVSPLTASQQALALWTEFCIDQTESPELIEAYIRQIEDAPLIVYKARQRLAEVQEFLRQREAAAWDAAAADNTDAAFESYLQVWPSGAHAADAQTRIALLRENVQWKTALEAGTLQGFRDYLRDYPRGNYCEEAQVIVEAKAKALSEEEDIHAGRIVRVMVGAGGKRDEAKLIKPGASECFKDIDIGPEMVTVPAGEFLMGSLYHEEKQNGNEGPQHKVIIPRAFAVGRCAVTFDEWDAAVADGACNGYKPKDNGWGRGHRPVINVSWLDVQHYLKWLKVETGKAYRLLSEAEWEYVCRAGTMTNYWWGNVISEDQANYYDIGLGKTVPVGSFKPNPWGLYQVHGNVWEWCEDCWHDNYNGAPADSSAWLDGGDEGHRVLRGGSCLNFPWSLSAAYRSRKSLDKRDKHVGFRVSRTF